MKEYIIWGKETAEATHENILVSEHANIQSMEQAEQTVKMLENWGCTDLRIQVIDFNDPGSINNMFIKSINI